MSESSHVHFLPCAWPRSDAIKVAAEVIVVEVTLLYVVGHLPLPLPCFLCVLELESVLVHREAHSLVRGLVSTVIPS